MGGVRKDDLQEIDKEFMQEIGDNLRREIKKKYNRLRTFGEILGISEPSILRWTNGQATPNILYVYKICKILDISIEDIMGNFFIDTDKSEKEKKDEKEKKREEVKKEIKKLLDKL